MNIAQLIDQFELVPEIEEGLEKLRKVILNLAVKGNLTNNLSTNGTASQLLKEIELEKKRQKDNGLITRIPDVEHEKDWAKELSKYPDDWLVTKLGNVLNLEYGKGLPTKKRNSDGSHPVYGSNGPMDYHDEYLVEGPCLVIGRKGSAGAINLTYENCWPTDVTYFVKPTDSIDIKYSYYLLKSLDLEELSKGIKPGLNRNEAYELFVGIPPLKLQKSIVQKIETLFSQVDQLEQKVQQDRAVDERLQVAVLDDLQRAETPEASRESWQRLTENFEQIYRKPDHIDQLKQAILNEAVRGRLVAQDPSDEPAEQLLERIKEEKQRLYEEGEIRKPKELPEIAEEEIPHELPEGWEWSKFGDIAYDFMTGVERPKKDQDPSYTYPYVKMNNITATGQIDLSDLVYVQATTDEVEKYKLRVGDFLFNTRNSEELVGKTCVFRGGEESPYLFNNNILRVDFGNSLSPDYINSWFNSYICNALLNSITSATTNVAAIYQKDLLKLLVPIPPKEEQVRIINRVDELFTWCDSLKSTLHRARQTDRRLLEALVGGAD